MDKKCMWKLNNEKKKKIHNEIDNWMIKEDLDVWQNWINRKKKR